MIVIVNVKVYPIPGKSARIFYGIFHTVHDNFCSDRNNRIISIHSKGMVGSGIGSTGCRAASPLSAADAAAAVSACYDLSNGFPHPDCSCLCYSFCFSLGIEGVLRRKQFFDFRLHIGICPIAVYSSQIRNQMIRIMGNFTDVVLILVITGVLRFHIVDLAVQSIFQFQIGVFRCIDIFIGTWISGNPYHGSASLNGCAAASKGYGDQ